MKKLDESKVLECNLERLTQLKVLKDNLEELKEYYKGSASTLEKTLSTWEKTTALFSFNITDLTGKIKANIEKKKR